MALQNAFIGNEIYRAGGDEFLVLLPDTSPEETENRIQKLRSISPSYGGVNFAVGSSYLTDGNILRALHEADEAMYADKKQFYLSHPELKNGSCL